MLGSWLSIGSPVIAEIAALSGFEWLLFDLEHGNESEAALPAQLRAISATSCKAIVRVGAPHSDLISRVLDWGAHGIMVPHVQSASEAEAIVKAAHYAPRGHRGFSRSARCYGYGKNPPTSIREISSPIIMAQIENLQGVENVDSIAAVDGIDVLFVGPADLQFDLQARTAPPHLTYENCLTQVCGAAKRHQKKSGILIRDSSQLGNHQSLGFTHIAIDSDLAILRKGYEKILSH